MQAGLTVSSVLNKGAVKRSGSPACIRKVWHMVAFPIRDDPSSSLEEKLQSGTLEWQRGWRTYGIKDFYKPKLCLIPARYSHISFLPHESRSSSDLQMSLQSLSDAEPEHAWLQSTQSSANHMLLCKSKQVLDETMSCICRSEPAWAWWGARHQHHT